MDGILSAPAKNSLLLKIQRIDGTVMRHLTSNDMLSNLNYLFLNLFNLSLQFLKSFANMPPLVTGTLWHHPYFLCNQIKIFQATETMRKITISRIYQLSIEYL